MSNNPEILQGKINYLTKRKEVERDNDTGNFTKQGNDSYVDKVYAKGTKTKAQNN